MDEEQEEVRRLKEKSIPNRKKKQYEQSLEVITGLASG